MVVASRTHRRATTVTRTQHSSLRTLHWRLVPRHEMPERAPGVRAVLPVRHDPQAVDLEPVPVGVDVAQGAVEDWLAVEVHQEAGAVEDDAEVVRHAPVDP